MQFFLLASLLAAAVASPMSTPSPNGDNGASKTNVTSAFENVFNVSYESCEDESCKDVWPGPPVVLVHHQRCNFHSSDGFEWVVSDWTGCDSCISRYYTREALCAAQGRPRQVVSKELCSHQCQPVLEKECDWALLPSCQPQWFASQWSKCSVDCGVGVKTRGVFCGSYSDGLAEMVDEIKCDPGARYNNTATCEVPDELCPAKWYTSVWTEASRYRRSSR